jgi:hypothetical protein
MAVCQQAFRIAALAASAVILAGCGSGGENRLSKSEYEHRVRSVYAGVQAAFRETRSVSGADLAGAVAAAQQRLRDAADELDAVEPPKDVEEGNEELVEGMREYADDLGELREAVVRGNEAAVTRFNAEIGENPAVKQIAEAAEEMKFRGYDLGPIAED